MGNGFEKCAKSLLFMFGSVLTALVLAGCAGATSSAPTTIPSETPIPSPVPTNTPAVVFANPLVTAPYLEFGSWSPDSQWIAYWVSSQEDMEQGANFMPGGTLNFKNVTTGDTCAVSQFVTADNRSANVYWSDDME